MLNKDLELNPYELDKDELEDVLRDIKHSIKIVKWIMEQIK